MFRLKVKEIAESQGISQSRLSRLADVDPKVVRQIYQRPDASVTLYVLDKLAKALHVNINLLIESVSEE
jgi:transcriptional regulator with XRE-family HTH domain